MTTIGMIGLGNFGTTIANLIASNGHPVHAWEYNADIVREVNTSHTNSHYLTGVALNHNLTATTNLAEVLSGCDPLFIAIPTAYIHSTVAPLEADIPATTRIVNMAKGIDRQTGLTACSTLRNMLPNNPLLMLSGPSIANEIIQGAHTTVMLAGPDDDVGKVSSCLESTTFHIRTSGDVDGIEWGGVLKNIYTIGLGVLDGAGITAVNTRAAYLTSAIAELETLGVTFGAQGETLRSLSGLGDLLATALSEHSHNRHFGEQIAVGKSLEDIRAEMGVLPEGYNALQSVLARIEDKEQVAPIALCIWGIINGERTPDDFLRVRFHGFEG